MTSSISVQPSDREKALRLAVGTTFLSLLPTAFAALQSNSVILFADLLRCLIEFLAIFLAWLILRRIATGSGGRFDYGYGKLEQASSIGVAFAMFVTFAVVIVSSALRFANPTPLENTHFGFVLGVLSVIGNLYLWLRYRAISLANFSPLMDSQARLFRAKTMATIVIVFSLLPSFVGSNSEVFLYADPIGSIVLGLLLLHSALGLISSSTKELLDCSLDEATQMLILRALVELDSEYEGLAQIRSRRVGGSTTIELFLEFPSLLTIGDFEKRNARIRAKIQESIPKSEILVVPLASTAAQ